MRNTSSVLVSGLVLGALVAPAHADPKDSSRGATVAVLGEPAPASRLTTGSLGLTGATRTPRLEPFLTPAEITAAVAPRAAEIERCYLDHVTAQRAGHLDVMFEIARDGHVLSVMAAASGFTPRTAQQVTSCIRTIAQAVQFPARRNDLTVVLPYYFQKTTAPDAGPQLSCWSPKGC